MPPGNPQRLVGVLVATAGRSRSTSSARRCGPARSSRPAAAGCATSCCDCGGPSATSSSARVPGCAWSPGLACDLHEFQRQAADALAAARADPELAGQLAAEAVALGDAPVFVDFEYDDWAVQARRGAEQQLISLLDLLSVQAEDAGDLPAAQALAERALRLDRYTDSRYVRLAELLTLQNRVAAAIAVLDDAAEVARDMGDGSPGATKRRRDELLRRAATGV